MSADLMAWIESHQELANHPKTRRFCRALGIGKAQAIGHLHLLWWWALDYAQDGNLTGFDADEIADACEWEGDPRQLAHALEVSGFMDVEDNQLHDWEEYGGKYLRRRDQARERQKRHRTPETRESRSDNAPVADGHALVTRDSRVSHTATEEEITRQDKTGEDHPPLPPEGGSDDPGYTQEFQEFWRAYPRVVNNSKLKAFRAWRGLKEPARRAARDALPRFLASDGWRRGFAPHTSTYLNGRLWEAEQPDKPAQPAAMRSKNNDPAPMFDLAERYERQGR